MEQDKTNNELKTLFHDAFADWETPPAAGVWNRVEVILDQENKKRPGTWWWFSGAILLLLGFGLWYFWPMVDNSTVNPDKNSVITTKQIENHKTDSINATKLIIKKHDDSLASVIKMKTDSLSAKDSITAAANAQSTQLVSQKTKSPTSKIIPAKDQYSESFSTSPQAKPLPVQIKKVNYIRTDSLLSALPSTTSATSQKQTSLENITQHKPTKKDSSAIAKPIITTEESFSSTNQVKSTKKKDSVVAKRDTTLQQATINSINARADSSAQQKKTDSLLASKRESKDSAKKDSLAKTTKKDSTAKGLTSHVLSISGFFSPELAKIDVTANNSKFNAQNVTPKAKYSAGIKLGYTLNKRVQLNIGLSYSQFHQDFHSDTVSFPKSISQPFVFNSVLGSMAVPAATMLSGFSPLAPVSRFRMNYEYNQTLQFINIPITARFNFSTGKFKPYVDAGVNIQYAFSQHATLDLLKEIEFDELDYNTLEVRTLNFAAAGGLGLEYDFSKHIGVYIEPNARVNLETNSTNSTVTSKSSFVGCQTGIDIQF